MVVIFIGGGGFYRWQVVVVFIGGRVAQWLQVEWGLTFQILHPLAMWPWASQWTFLSFGFIICKTEEIIVPNFKGVKRVKWDNKCYYGDDFHKHHPYHRWCWSTMPISDRDLLPRGLLGQPSCASLPVTSLRTSAHPPSLLTDKMLLRSWPFDRAPHPFRKTNPALDL